MKNNKHIQFLISKIKQASARQEWTAEADRQFDELVALGGPAVAPVMAAMDEPSFGYTGKRDYFDPRGRGTLGGMFAVLTEMARIDPEPLIEVVLRDAAKPDPQMWAVVSVLGKCRTDRAMEALVAASRHRNSSVRWAALIGLVDTRDPCAIEPVVRALRDRASLVQGVAIEAVNSSATDFFRVPAAAENLRRLLAYRNLEVKDPVSFERVKEALAKMER